MEKSFDKFFLGNAWCLFKHNDGYDYYIKTEYVNDKPRSVLIDNFSVSPLGVYGYDIDKLQLKDDLSKLYENKIISSTDYDILILKDVVSDELIKEVSNLLYNFLEIS